MRMIMPVLSLAMLHVAGGNLGVVPDAAAKLGSDVYAVTVSAYMVFGAALAGLSAWIGARTGHELGVVAKRLFGQSGKWWFAVATLAISLPASALTGSYFAALIFTWLTGLPVTLTALVCLTVFAGLALWHRPELMVVSGYLSLGLFPLLAAMVYLQPPTPVPGLGEAGSIDWGLVAALVAYNAGGMRSALVAEAATCLAHRSAKAVCLTVAAKGLEGLLTLAAAYVVIGSGGSGPLALLDAAEDLLGPVGAPLLGLVFLALFLNTMVPAMTVNARQTAILTGLGQRTSMLLATLAVYGLSFVPYGLILQLMAGACLLLLYFICATVRNLHKYASSQL